MEDKSGALQSDEAKVLPGKFWIERCRSGSDRLRAALLRWPEYSAKLGVFQRILFVLALLAVASALADTIIFAFRPTYFPSLSTCGDDISVYLSYNNSKSACYGAFISDSIGSIFGKFWDILIRIFRDLIAALAFIVLLLAIRWIVAGRKSART